MVWFKTFNERFIFNSKREKNTYFTDLYIKPYPYFSPFTNGLIIGYLCASNNFPTNYRRYLTIVNFIKNLCFSANLILTTIISLELIIFQKRTSLFSLAISVGPILTSIYFGTIFANEALKMKNISRYWRHVRHMTRISYVFHPLNFAKIKLIFPVFELKFTIISLHYIIVIFTNFLISIIIRHCLEIPFIYLMKIQICNMWLEASFFMLSLFSFGYS